MRPFVIGLALLAVVSTAYADEPGLLLPNRPGAGDSFADEVGRAAEVAAVAALARFDSWLTAHPDDADAASERCRFLDRMSYSEEDWSIRFAEAAETCGPDLDRDFGSTLAAMAYAVESSWGEEVRTAAERFFSSGGEGSRYELAVRKWLVYALEAEEEADERIDHARAAMRLDPALDLSYELAGALKSLGDESGAIEELLARSESDSNPWQHGLKAKLLYDLGAYEASVKQFERAAAGEAYVDRMAWVKSLAALGRLADAREQLKRHVEQPSGLESAKLDALSAAVEFERDHGDAESTRMAYQALRDEGYMADPLARLRIAISVAHPEIPWQGRDVLGVLSLIGAMGIIALVPALVFLPVHYVGLRRAVRDPTRPPVATLYPLRRAWLACSLLLVTQIGALLVLAPDSILSALLEDAWETEAVIPSAELASLAVAVVMLGLIAALVSGRGGLRELLGPGRWSLGRSIGAAIVALLLLLPVAGLSKLLADALAQASLTKQMIQAVFDQYGALAMIGGVAIVTPLAEEILFRGVILAGVARHLASGWANLVQATLFAVFHEELALMPFYLAIGLTTGWLTQRSGSIRAAVLLHGTNNGLACMALLATAARSTS